MQDNFASSSTSICNDLCKEEIPGKFWKNMNFFITFRVYLLEWCFRKVKWLIFEAFNPK